MKDYVELGTAIEKVDRADEQKRLERLDSYRKALQEAVRREESEGNA